MEEEWDIDDDIKSRIMEYLGECPPCIGRCRSDPFPPHLTRLDITNGNTRKVGNIHFECLELFIAFQRNGKGQR